MRGVALYTCLLERGSRECDSRQAPPTSTAWWAGCAVQQLAQSRPSAPSVSRDAPHMGCICLCCLYGCASLQLTHAERLEMSSGWTRGLQLTSQIPRKVVLLQLPANMSSRSGWSRCVAARLLVLHSMPAITLPRAHLGTCQLRCIQQWAHCALPQVGCSSSHVRLSNFRLAHTLGVLG